MTPDQRPILFFDGVCGLCSGVVRWLYRKDKNNVWAFAPLQGAKAQLLLSPSERESLSTLIVRTPSGEHLTRGAAVRYIAETLPGLWGIPWGIRILLRWIPLPLLNLMYRLVAGTRYSVFGKVEYCELIPKEDRDRFFD